jgi:hypothetical protein
VNRVHAPIEISTHPFQRSERERERGAKFVPGERDREREREQTTLEREREQTTLERERERANNLVERERERERCRI